MSFTPLHREVLTHGAGLIENVVDDEIEIREPGNGWTGRVLIRGNQAAIELEGLPPDVLNAVLDALRDEYVRREEDVGNHLREPGRNEEGLSNAR